MKVFIAGARGRVGSAVAEHLRDRGVDVVAGDIEDGIDVITGDGLAETLAGVDTIVNVLNTSQFDAAAATSFFERSTHNLTAAGEQAGVRHHVLLSIVGVGQGDASSNGYYLGKVAQEKALLSGSIPATVVRATQFHEYVPVLIDQHTADGTVMATRGLIQPVALSEVVALLVEVALSSEPRGAVEVAGPERFHLDDLFRATLAARDDDREVETVESPDLLDGLVPRGPHEVGSVRYPVRGIPTAA